MLLRRNEKKSLSPWITLIVGTLAGVGAVSIARCGRSWVRCKIRKIEKMFHREVREPECEG